MRGVYFTTKRALTNGIEKKELETWRKDLDALIPVGNFNDEYYRDVNAFLTFQEALQSAEVMREKRLGLLHRQTEKITNLKFREPQ